MISLSNSKRCNVGLLLIKSPRVWHEFKEAHEQMPQTLCFNSKENVYK